jgi:hypothetical protein
VVQAAVEQTSPGVAQSAVEQTLPEVAHAVCYTYSSTGCCRTDSFRGSTFRLV